MKLLLSVLCIVYAVAIDIDRDWWKHSTIYEIYTASFKDSNGDGYGDLKGVTSKLDYLKDLGVDVIELTPLFPSLMLDTGYDVSDYRGINPRFGTMDDFNELMRQLKRRGMKLIIDFVINQSSDQHIWFQKSVDRVNPYTNYYVWEDSKGLDEAGKPIPPNNWLSFFGNSAWTWNEKRQQFYYHVFLPEQPDLNLQNRAVKNEILRIMKFWLDKGVAGIRLHATNWLFEDQSYEDEYPIDQSKMGQEVPYWEINHDKTQNIDATFDYLCELRKDIDKLSARAKNYERILIQEAWASLPVYKRFYGTQTNPGVHFPLNFLVLLEKQYLDANRVNEIIDQWMEITPKSSSPNWLIDSHDRTRTSFTYIQEYVNIWLTIITLLPGITVLYYGEELGMTSGVVRPEQVRFETEHARSPMQWDDTTNAGFTTNTKPWIPVNPNYWRLNVKKQQKEPESTYNFLKALLKLKKTKTMKYGDLNKYVLSEWVFAFKRSYNYFEDYIVVMNLGTEKQIVSLRTKMPLPSVLKVCLASNNAGKKKGEEFDRKERRSFVIQPMSVIVLCQELQAGRNNLQPA